MRKLNIFLITIMILCNNIIAQDYKNDSYILFHDYEIDYKKKNKIFESYFYEYFFDEQGFFKQINQYEVKEKINYYDWENIKHKYRLISSFDVQRIEDGIFIKNYPYGKNPIQDWAFTSPKHIDRKPVMFKIIDDELELVEFYKDEEKAEIVKVEFDKLNYYKIIYTGKTINHIYDETIVNIFISKPINFIPQARIVNNRTDKSPYFAGIDIVGHNILPKPEYTYINNKEKLVFRKDYLSLTGNKKTSFTNPNYKLSEVKGMRKISFKDEEDKLLLKNSDFTILYHKNQKTPSFIGWNPEKPLSIVKIKNINASSFLQEKETSYKAENLLKAQLDAPWVEGVQGDGIGEYIELDKAEATGMYIVNGFVSLDRPDLYEKNNRVEYVYIEGLNSGKKIGYRLVDTAKPQYIDLEGFEKEKIKITIRNVYKGTKYQDTCISGIFLVKETK